MTLLAANDTTATYFTPEKIGEYTDMAVTGGLKLIAALAIFIIGKWIAGKIRSTVRNTLTKRNVDLTLVTFGSSLLYYGLMVVVVIAAIQRVGFQTTSLVAVLGAAGLAIGLALQGSLSNFASGVLIILFRPFKVGDVIETAGQVGAVQEIGILLTILHSADNKRIVIPNSSVMSSTIINVTANDTRRVDMTVGVSYSDNLDKVQELILEVLKADKRVLADPAPQVVVGELGASSVNFTVRPWVKTEDYWAVFFDFQKTIKQRLDKEGVTIPFPQQDVYMHQVS